MLSAIHPLTFGLMPVTSDGLLHLYRLIALDHAIRHGDWWPRYVPGFLFGYGAPVFNYYAPLSLYPMEGLHLLGMRFLDALLVSMIVYALFGTVGAYLFGKIWGGPIAGVVTAVAYAYAPYILYDWPRRGAVAEFAALMLLPWILWAFWRLAMWGQRRDLALAATTFGVLILTHNITALYFAPLLAAYGAFVWWTSTHPPHAFIKLVLALVLALGWTAFFWLPALAETRYVFIERVSYGVANLDFHNNFQSLTETFAGPLTADLTQLHPPVPRPLGWLQIALALTGAVLLLSRSTLAGREEEDRLRGWLGVALAGLIILILLTTAASAWLWELIPLMNFIQFPWRLLGPSSLLLASLAGMGAALVAQYIFPRIGQAAWAAACIVGMMAYALPWLYGAYLPDPPARNIVDAQNFERVTGWLAGTAAGEYVPIWTTQLPDQDRLLGLYAESEVIPRLQPNDEITIESMSWQAMGTTLSFEAREDTQLVFDWLYFPGWWARLDGESVPITPTTPQGYLSIEAAEGEHSLEVGFGPTPLRLGAGIASGVCALTLAGTLFVPGHFWAARKNQEATSISLWPTLGATAAAGLLVFGLKVLWIDHVETPIKRARFANGIDAGVETPVQADFNHQIVLLGYDLMPRQTASGDRVRLQLYWRLAGDEIAENYSSVIYLRDAAGNIILQTGSQHPGDLPTSDWINGGFYVQERLTLQAPPGTPPGSYDIDAALYSHTMERNLDVWNAGGMPVGVAIPIGTLEVTRPAWPDSVSALGLENQFDEPATSSLALVGIENLPAEIEVGQPFVVNWGWRAEELPSEAYNAELLWLDAGGEIAATSPAIPLVTGYPTDQWQRGDVWRGLHVLYVPGRLDKGNYQVAVRILDSSGQLVGEQIAIGEMEITTPPRTFERPEPDNLMDASWAMGIHLLGYDLVDRRVAPREAVELTLYWQTQSDLAVNLTMFVHLVDESGNIVAQVDQIPVQGTRPTTGWAPGEVIENPIQVYISPEVSPGEYSLRIGWYDATTGTRIPLNSGGDTLSLPATVRIVRGS